MKRLYLLWKLGQVWYYKLPDIKHYLSTGKTTRRAAENYVVDVLNRKSASVPCYYNFRKYAQPFFIQDRFPHIRRLREEGKSVTRRHAKIQHLRVQKHILSDPYSAKRLSDILREDVLDLRSRLLGKYSPARVNKIIGIMKVIFRKALHTEEINRDPAVGAGRIKITASMIFIL